MQRWIHALVLTALLGAPGLVAAQTVDNAPLPHAEGFWFSGGMGFGSMGCQDCASRADGLSGGLSFGRAVSDKVLLGVGTTGWSKSLDDGTLLTVGTLDARVRFYPTLKSGFFINGGVGLGTVSAGSSVFSPDDVEMGVGIMLGVGYDVRLNRKVSLTPFWNGSAMANSSVDANFGQIGVAVTLH